MVWEVEQEAFGVSDGRLEDGVSPSAPPVGADAPDIDVQVVTPAPKPNEGIRRIPSRRRRRRVLAAFLVIWAFVVAAAGAAWYEYGRLSHDLRVSNGRVAAPVQHALTPAPAGAAEQTTLVAGIDSHRNVAGTVIVARVDATRHAVEILTVPSTVALSSAQRLRDVLRFDGVSRTINLLERDLRVPINHVLLIQLGQVGAIVHSLGGITIANPARVRYHVGGASGVFPAGRVALTGRTVQRYLAPAELTRGAAAADFRQAVVVRGVTDKLVHLTTPSSITAVGNTISHNFDTDLSPDPVLGIVAARLRAHTLVDCRLAPAADLARAGSIATVSGFTNAKRRGSCTATPLVTKLPVAAVAATVIATLVTHGGSRLLYWLVVATIAIWGFAACAWFLMLPAVRGVHGLPRTRGLPQTHVTGMPRLSRPRMPDMPHIGRPHRPQLRLPKRAHDRHGRVYRRRGSRAYLIVRVVSVPASIGLGMLIADLLY
jgi:anionic cell wall polymer biosynthesis LytR-Cps2A-Psr (LCP) family protein